MSDSPNLYCKILVDSDAEKRELLERIASLSSGSIQRWTVASPEFEADLEENEDFDEVKRLQGQDQFLFYRYYLDVEPTGEITREHYVKAVGEFLEGLWRSGHKAVAACDFESALPRKGGYTASSAE